VLKSFYLYQKLNLAFFWSEFFITFHNVKLDVSISPIKQLLSIVPKNKTANDLKMIQAKAKSNKELQIGIPIAKNTDYADPKKTLINDMGEMKFFIELPSKVQTRLWC
jgi:hypothetical protein